MKVIICVQVDPLGVRACVLDNDQMVNRGVRGGVDLFDKHFVIAINKAGITGNAAAIGADIAVNGESICLAAGNGKHPEFVAVESLIGTGRAEVS